MIVYSCLLLNFMAVDKHANAADYWKCQITAKQVFSKESVMNGKLLNDVGESSAKEFIINKEDGKMFGALTNHNSYGKPRVIDSGNGGNSFVAITEFQDGVSEYLRVRSWAEDEKAFVYIDWLGQVYSGWCIDY